MLSRALQVSIPASLIRGFCASPQAAEVVKEVVEKAHSNERAQAAITPEELLTRVVGTSRVPGIVRERFLVTYFGQQQAQQEAKALYQSQQVLHQAQQAEPRQKLESQLEELRQKLESQQYQLLQEARERARWEVSATHYKHLTDLRTREVLVLTGRMNLRGLLEYAEIEAKKSGAPTDKGRTGLWKWILKRNPQLVACITSSTTWKENVIPVRIQSLYDTLNKHHHVGKTPVEWTADGGLIIEEGAKVSILDCRLLHCVCELHGITAQVVPAVDDVRIHDFKMHEE